MEYVEGLMIRACLLYAYAHFEMNIALPWSTRDPKCIDRPFLPRDEKLQTTCPFAADGESRDRENEKGRGRKGGR
jgi:hypothetical protein